MEGERTNKEIVPGETGFGVLESQQTRLNLENNPVQQNNHIIPMEKHERYPADQL